MLSKILEFYAKHGRSLSDEGIEEAAIPIGVADHALNLFLEAKVLIVGGDIYRKVDASRLKPTYENWYYDGNSVIQGIAEAREYLSTIAVKDNYYVSFIFS